MKNLENPGLGFRESSLGFWVWDFRVKGLYQRCVGYLVTTYLFQIGALTSRTWFGGYPAETYSDGAVPKLP